MKNNVILVLILLVFSASAFAECIPSGELNTACDLTQCCGYTGVWRTEPDVCKFGMDLWNVWCSEEGGQDCPSKACWVDLCKPKCNGKVCGDDGCGGSCGACDSGFYCDLGACTIIDNDGDGYNNAVDCDDWDESVYPGAEEVCDSADNDCDGEVDEDDVCGWECYDIPYNNPEVCSGNGECAEEDVCVCIDGWIGTECETPEIIDNDEDGFDSEQDCDDNDVEINPDAVEMPGNAVDENCDEEKSCDSEKKWKTHGHYVACVTKEAWKLYKARDITKAQRKQLIIEAARSDIGKRIIDKEKIEKITNRFKKFFNRWKNK